MRKKSSKKNVKKKKKKEEEESKAKYTEIVSGLGVFYKMKVTTVSRNQ